MTEYIYAFSAIVPSAHAENARRVLWVLGHDTADLTTFPMPLSADKETTTHYGLHSAADKAMIDLVTNAAQGNLPDMPWPDYGLTADTVVDTVRAMTIVYSKNGDVSQTFPKAMERAGVVSIDDENI